MNSIISHFNWCLRDVNLWLSLNEYSVTSPAYSMGDPTCKFYLEFGYAREANQLRMFLCRGYDDGPNQVDTRFYLGLKTAGGHILCSSECTVFLPMNGREGFTFTMSKDDLLAYLEKERERDAIIVTCELVLLEPTFTYLTKDVRDLSVDLLKLRSDSLSANGFLLAQRERIPVHKEILCSRSLAIKKAFNNSDYWWEQHFSAAVMKKVLDYLYSSSISLKELENRHIAQLLLCANHYQISDLERLLTPRKTYVTSMLNSKTETHTLQFSYFTELCKRSYSVEHHRIKMQFNENTEMSVKILFEPYSKYGQVVLETSLFNLVDVKSIFVRIFILDHSNPPIPQTVDEIHLEVDEERQLKFYLEYQSESLFSGSCSIVQSDILTLRFELKFQLPGELHISDPDSTDGLANHEPSFALIRSMESLLRTKLCADAFLLPSTKKGVPGHSQVSVHKHILSVRSPEFKSMFTANVNTLAVDLDETELNYLLHYVYTGVMVTSRPRILEKLHKAAETYRINPLKRACEEVVAKMNLDIRNFYSIYSIAFRGELYELRKTCKDFMMQNKDLIIGSWGWDRLKEQRNCLESD